MSKTLSVRLFFVLLLSGIIIFLPGCEKSENSDEEPPVYSPARVLTPEAPLWFWIFPIRIRDI